MSLDLLERSVVLSAAQVPGEPGDDMVAPNPQVSSSMIPLPPEPSTAKYRTTRSTIFAGSVFKVPVRVEGTAIRPDGQLLVISIVNTNVCAFCILQRAVWFGTTSKPKRVMSSSACVLWMTAAVM